MNKVVVKVLESQFINYDVKRFVVEKPEGYDFIPGQAVNISVNEPEWKMKERPFTFTNQKEAKNLEFIIKIYNDHNGVTNRLAGINAGDELILHDIFGAIHYEKPGVFIAAGTGITPFLAIFRDLYKKNKLRGNKLIFVNKTSLDVIAGQELQRMFKEDFRPVFTREGVVGFRGKRIDRNFLIENIVDFSQHFYVCGPSEFVGKVVKNLKDLGAKSDSLIFEE
ncbi:FAD-binding oxidoreductase [uncultured Flavobacterium sp.]|uniref:FAD-binding oxidoreductase n=1 Tax=uncultured Flavobacterium sp. TaxID=165435 RepID=UPI0030EC51F3|tara:strand:+ start:123 stop:791 length:669 start_codon:yes stop_codon:yes gene_type:complete